MYMFKNGTKYALEMLIKSLPVENVEMTDHTFPMPQNGKSHSL